MDERIEIAIADISTWARAEGLTPEQRAALKDHLQRFGEAIARAVKDMALDLLQGRGL